MVGFTLFPGTSTFLSLLAARLPRLRDGCRPMRCMGTARRWWIPKLLMAPSEFLVYMLGSVRRIPVFEGTHSSSSQLLATQILSGSQVAGARGQEASFGEGYGNRGRGAIGHAGFHEAISQEEVHYTRPERVFNFYLWVMIY